MVVKFLNKYQKGEEMSVLQSIQQWGLTLPVWQQHAISRLFAAGVLDAQDEEDIYALLKNEHGIPDAKKRIAEKLDANIATAVESKKLVQIVSIKNLRHVNALAENQNLPIGAQGVTVIYGDNGSGKSGYSRVLKKACRARDQKEVILPNANTVSKPNQKSQASFSLLIDGIATEVNWVNGETPPDPLTAISVFDTRCARAYLDEQNDYSYVPYGMDILEGLAVLCKKMRLRIEQEAAQAAPNLAQFTKLSQTQTAVGKLVSTLSSKTKIEAIEKLATLSQQEFDRHAFLDKGLKEGNPKEKAQQMKLFSSRIIRFSERCTEKLKIVNVDKINTLHDLVEATKLAKKNASTVAQLFKDRPNQLAGTGGEAWQILFEAARKFALESHQGKEFPHLDEKDQCPLCQQPLNDAANRLVEFDTFIQGELEKLARETRATAGAAFHLIRDADLNIGFDADLKTELSTSDADIVMACESFQKSLLIRGQLTVAACEGKSGWDVIGDEPVSPVPNLLELSKRLTGQAEALEKISDEKERLVLINEFNELNARIEMNAVKVEIINTLNKSIRQAQLSKCAAATRTNSITAKSTELTEQVISKELAKALTDEYSKLNVENLKVSLRSFSEKGKTYHKLILEISDNQNLSAILSEGEQRAVAIGSFLAEVNISGGKGGIIFDDPVSSLDHRRRAQVAKRLAEEGKKRQVIIFTHDLYFLCLLQQECVDLGIDIHPLSLNRTPDGFGVTSQELPFDGATTSKRIGILKTMYDECVKYYKAGDEKARVMHTRNAYFHLRLAWERAVEEVLFRSVVMRFGEGISTQRLQEVVVEDEDYFTIDAGMTKCSKYAHDGAAAGNVATPEPSELDADIEALERWRKTVEKRKDDIRKRRKI